MDLSQISPASDQTGFFEPMLFPLSIISFVSNSKDFISDKMKPTNGKINPGRAAEELH